MSGPVTVPGALGKRGDEGDPSGRPTPTRAQPRGHRRARPGFLFPSPVPGGLLGRGEASSACSQAPVGLSPAWT